MNTATNNPTQKPVSKLNVVQLSTRSLFLLTSFCAVGIALVHQLDIFGTVILFAVASGASIIMFRRHEFGQRRFWLQASWGVLLPLCCLFTDPIVFRRADFGEQVYPPFVLTCYSFIAWQMLMLGASWFLKPTQPRWSSFLAGSLMAGALFAACVGLALLPATLLFSLMILGLPGFTPLFTAVVFFNAGQIAWRVASLEESSSTRRGLAVLGGVSSIFIAAAPYFILRVTNVAV